MMVGPTRTVAAFCSQKGEISTEEITVERLTKKYPVLGKPFIRGIFFPDRFLSAGVQGPVPLRR